MILTLDVGNTNIFAGVYDGSEIILRFRKTTKDIFTSDELGIFLKQVLKENKLDPDKIKHIATASVVPSLNYTITNCCIKYFGIEPFFIAPGVKTGLNFRGHDSDKLGADRVANIIGAMHLYPGQNLIVIDFGTANTYCAVSKNKEYKGGAIQAGLATSLNALAQNTAQLFNVEIKNPGSAAGMTTVTQLQAGLYYGNLGAVKEFVSRYKTECFPAEEVKVVATGGMARMYEGEQIIDAYHPDLVLLGIKLALENNK